MSPGCERSELAKSRLPFGLMLIPQNLCSRRWIPRQSFRDLQEIQRLVDL